MKNENKQTKEQTTEYGLKIYDGRKFYFHEATGTVYFLEGEALFFKPLGNNTSNLDQIKNLDEDGGEVDIELMRGEELYNDDRFKTLGEFDIWLKKILVNDKKSLKELAIETIAKMIKQGNEAVFEIIAHDEKLKTGNFTPGQAIVLENAEIKIARLVYRWIEQNKK